METELEHLMIIDYKAARHFISRLHVIYYIMWLKYANNAFNIMYPCFIHFHFNTKIAYSHSKRPKKALHFRKSIFLLLIFFLLFFLPS